MLLHLYLPLTSMTSNAVSSKFNEAPLDGHHVSDGDCAVIVRVRTEVSSGKIKVESGSAGDTSAPIGFLFPVPSVCACVSCVKKQFQALFQPDSRWRISSVIQRILAKAGLVLGRFSSRE